MSLGLTDLSARRFRTPGGCDLLAADLRPDWKAERIARDRAALTLAKADGVDCSALSRSSRLLSPSRRRSRTSPRRTIAGQHHHGYSLAGARNSGDRRWLARRNYEKVLDDHHQLENTIIVVFGDHGIRTRRRTRILNVSAETLDEYSFHVPLRIYAARALAAPVRISWLTSHIDVAPTVLDLLVWSARGRWNRARRIGNRGLPGGRRFFWRGRRLERMGFMPEITFICGIRFRIRFLRVQ